MSEYNNIEDYNYNNSKYYTKKDNYSNKYNCNNINNNNDTLDNFVKHKYNNIDNYEEDSNNIFKNKNKQFGYNNRYKNKSLNFEDDEEAYNQYQIENRKKYQLKKYNKNNYNNNDEETNYKSFNNNYNYNTNNGQKWNEWKKNRYNYNNNNEEDSFVGFQCANKGYNKNKTSYVNKCNNEDNISNNNNNNSNSNYQNKITNNENSKKVNKIYNNLKEETERLDKEVLKERETFKKFVPPKKLTQTNNNDLKVKAKKNDVKEKAGGGDNSDDEDPRVKGIDKKLVAYIEGEILQTNPNISWSDIAGLGHAKDTIKEVIIWPLQRPDIFKGIRKPPKGLLLFGPPGTGKTMIAKAIASEAKAKFFNISASSLTSKWIGESEKLARSLFALASFYQPSVIFIDEIDSILSSRNENENEASRRLKTEFLVQLDGAGTNTDDSILIIGATNRPHEIDDAVIRRMTKRLYIPLPNKESRKELLLNVIKKESSFGTNCELNLNYYLEKDNKNSKSKITIKSSSKKVKSKCNNDKDENIYNNNNNSTTITTEKIHDQKNTEDDSTDIVSDKTNDNTFKIKLSKKEMQSQLDKIIKLTKGYSGSDLQSVCREAFMHPIREIKNISEIKLLSDIRPVNLNDFMYAINAVKASVASKSLEVYSDWNKKYGTFSCNDIDN